MTKYRSLQNNQEKGDYLEDDSDQYSVDNLDLLNLRTCFSSEIFGGKKTNPKSESFEVSKARQDRGNYKASGEGSAYAPQHKDITGYCEARHVKRPLHRFSVFKPNLQSADAEAAASDNSDNDKNSVVVLYERPKRDLIKVEEVSGADNKGLSCQKSHIKVVGPRKMAINSTSVVKQQEKCSRNCGRGCGDRKSKRFSEKPEPCKSSFPFKSTPSGNFKVEPTQVVFQSEKLSVLVSDPATTKVQVNMEKERSDFIAKMSMVLPLMNQPKGVESRLPPYNNDVPAEGCGSPRKCILSESSEYNGVHTDKILRPELNLQRLGFNASEIIDWSKVTLPQKANLYLELYQRITNYINADMKVYIENEQFNCHLLVLQCYSKFFDEVSSKSIELPVKMVSPIAFSFIYEWMITGQPAHKNLSRENVLEIFIAARYLRIKDLEEQCWAFIDSQEVFSEDTAFILYLQAKKMQMYDVMELMVPRISKFFLMLVSSQDFLDLDLEEVCAFLGSNYIQVNCEMEVIMSAVRWLKHDWENRKQYIVDLIKKVRFGHMAPWQLVEMKRNRECPEFHEVMAHPEVNRMIDDGLAYVIVRYWYGHHDSDYYNWLNALELEVPAERCWYPSERTFLTYREFLIYLDLYRKHQLSEKTRNRDKTFRGGHFEEPLVRTIGDSPPSQTITNKNNNSLLSTPHRESVAQTVGRYNGKDFSSGTVPTMDEFLATRKRDFVYFPPKQKLLVPFRRMKMKTPDEAARIIQLAYRHWKTGRRKHRPDCSRNAGAKTMVNCNYCAGKENAIDDKVDDGAESHDVKERTMQSPYGTSRGEHLKASGLVDNVQNCPSKSTIYFRGDGVIDSKNIKTRSLSRSFVENIWTSVQVQRNRQKQFTTEGSLFCADRESVLVFGGTDPHCNYGVGRNTGKDVYRYVPETNGWEFVTELPEPRHHHSVVFLKGRVFLVGGADPRELDTKEQIVSTVWSFDPVKRTWYHETGLSVARKNFGIATTKMRLYAIGGQDKDGRVLSSVEKYDPSLGIWVDVAPMLSPKMGMACAVFRENIWIAGGMTGSKKNPISSTIECYDVHKDQWTHIGYLRFPRCFGVFYVLQDNLFLIGGAGRTAERSKTTASVGDIDVWDEKSFAFHRFTGLAIPRHGHSVTYLGTQILIIGGVTTVYMRALSNVECYCVQRSTWVRGIGGLCTTLSGHGAVSLPPASLL